MSERTEDYMALRYPIDLIPDADGGYVAEHRDLPGCFAQGETPDEAVAAIDAARRAWIESRLDDGLPVPAPSNEREYSGKFIVRMPRSLHAQLVRLAAKESVSLNQYVSTILASHAGSTPLRSFIEKSQGRLEDLLQDLRIAAKQQAKLVGTNIAKRVVELQTIPALTYTYGDPSPVNTFAIECMDFEDDWATLREAGTPLKRTTPLIISERKRP